MELQELLKNLRTQKRSNSNLPDTGWKILPTTQEYNHQGVLVDVPNPRHEVVGKFLYECYRIEVENRFGNMERPDEDKFKRILSFMTTQNAKCGLILYGYVGTGKTTYMKAMEATIRCLYKEELQNRQLTMRSCQASELGQMLKEHKEDYDTLKKSSILFIDDIGFAGDAEVVNNYGVKTDPIIDIIEYRYAKQLFTVLTTNLSEDGITKRYGNRIYSRLYEMCKWICFKGKDYRIK